MAKREAAEYRSLVSDEGGGIIRGRIPSHVVRDLGARSGDYLVFKVDSSGKATVRVERGRSGSKKTSTASKTSKSKRSLIGKRR
jgi:hypothetical protein